MVPLRVTLVMQVTGTVARVSQVTGAVQTSPPTRAAAAITVANRITVYVPLTLVVAIPTARRVSTPIAKQALATALDTVQETAAVPLRIPTIGRHCEP